MRSIHSVDWFFAPQGEKPIDKEEKYLAAAG
jgi:hypothetical protein